MNEEITFDQADVDKNKNNALLMTIIPVLFFLPLVADDMKESAYLKFYANQSLIVTIAYALSGIAAGILGLIPIIKYFSWLVPLAIFVLFIINIVNASSGKGKQIPLLGGISFIK